MYCYRFFFLYWFNPKVLGQGRLASLTKILYCKLVLELTLLNSHLQHDCVFENLLSGIDYFEGTDVKLRRNGNVQIRGGVLYIFKI